MSVGEWDLSSSSPTILHCLFLTLVCYHKLYVGLSPSTCWGNKSTPEHEQIRKHRLTSVSFTSILPWLWACSVHLHRDLGWGGVMTVHEPQPRGCTNNQEQAYIISQTLLLTAFSIYLSTEPRTAPDRHRGGHHTCIWSKGWDSGRTWELGREQHFTDSLKYLPLPGALDVGYWVSDTGVLWNWPILVPHDHTKSLDNFLSV